MRHRRHGMALLTVIGIVAVLLVLALSFSAAVRTETRLTAGALGRTQAAWLAEAGIQRAYVELRDNPHGFTALHENATEDEALVLDIDSTDEETLGLERGRFEVQAFDEAARVNLNTADEELLNVLLASEPQLVNTLLDWRDEDAESREEGAEGDYYQGLESPYSARDDWFDTLDELLLLKDVAPERVLRLDDLSPVSGPPDPTVEQTATPLGDLFTVYSNDENLDLAGQQRVNVQTASAEDLNEALQDVLTPEEIQSIVQYRDGGGAAESNGAAGPTGAPAASDPVAAAAAALTPPGASTVPAAPAAASGDEAAPDSAPAEDDEEDRRPRTVAELVTVIGREKLQQVYDRLTVSDDPLQIGLINLNTAPLEILAALPGMDLTLAQAIVDARRQEPFETVGDLLRLSEVTDELFGQLAPLLTTRSAAFRLQASGTVGEGAQAITRRIVAVVLVETTSAAAPADEAAAAAPAAVDESATATAEEGPQRRLRLVYRKME
ncbi:MAG: general secretion pathway protein GspK [Fimbriimonadaceae bacterium]|nr:general secretion pathway protein GspK [Fimbriimonadaceae bacterium]